MLVTNSTKVWLGEPPKRTGATSTMAGIEAFAICSTDSEICGQRRQAICAKAFRGSLLPPKQSRDDGRYQKDNSEHGHLFSEGVACMAYTDIEIESRTK